MKEGYAGNSLATQACDKAAMAMRDDITVRQNIDAKISRHQAAIAELEATKVELGTLGDMRIDRLRNAMNGGIY